MNSLLSTRHCDFEVIVVDDRSTDATRSIVEAIAQRDPRLKIVAGAQLPDGWVGKPWALAQGARVARGAWLLFTDADTEHEPLAATSALQCALQNGYGVVSLLTDQQTIGLAERLPFAHDPFRHYARRRSYRRRQRPAQARCGDLQRPIYPRLTRGVRRNRPARSRWHRDRRGSRSWRADSSATADFESFLPARAASFARGCTCRSHRYGKVSSRTLQSGRRGVHSEQSPGRRFWLAFRRYRRSSCSSLWSSASGLQPAVLALSGAAIVAVAEFGMRRARFRPGSGIAVPLGLVVTLAIFATSLYCTFVGRGVEWRGRRYGGGLPRAR